MNIYFIPKNYNKPEIKINENKYETKICQSLVNFVGERNNTNIRSLMDLMSFDNNVKEVLKVQMENKYLLSFIEIVNYFNLMKEEIETYLIIFYIDDFSEFVDLNRFCRMNKNDVIISKGPIINENLKLPFVNENQFDLLVFEIKEKENFLQILKVIILNVKGTGHVIIKTNDTISQLFLEFLYILSYLFQKVLIVKPSVSNIVSMEKFIICSNFDLETDIKYNIEKAVEKNENEIYSIISTTIPNYFQNKVEDINVIFGQQFLESCDHCLNIYKSKNIEDKIENMKKSNNQKCNQWLEKNKIEIN